ncbi:MAG: Tn3 family transposase [Gammaproteobacteria bacterium]|jgi:TnpA family transposase|nr:Tn3 family transposase [Gammaproteobacteria bacterium]
MAAIHDTAYPRLASALSSTELKRLYSITRKEKTWIEKQRITQTSLLDTVVYLKVFQCLGYFPPPATIPAQIIQFIASECKLDSDNCIKPSQRLSHRIKQHVRHFCRVKPFSTKEHEKWLYDFACTMATTKDNPVDIINAMIEILVKESFELPGFSTLNKLANRARATTLDTLFLMISKGLSHETKLILNDLLTTKNQDGLTRWHELKKEPQKPTTQNIAEYIKHTQWLTFLQSRVGPLPDIPEQKRYQCLIEARAYSADRMKRMRIHKRESLMAIMIHEQRLYANDCLVDMLIRDVRKLHNAAKKALIDFQLQVSAESVSLVTLLRDVAGVCTTKLKSKPSMDRILNLFDHEPDAVVERCDKLVMHGADNYLQFLPKRYTNPVRKNSLDILDVIQIKAISSNNPLITCVDFILSNRQQKFASIRVDAIDYRGQSSHDSCVHWVAERWHKLLFVDAAPLIINRLMNPVWFELSVLTEVCKRLQSGDLYIDNSIKYDDYRTHLVDDATFKQELPQFCQETNLPVDAKVFAKQLKDRFVAQADATDKRFADDQYVVIEKGRLVLKRRPSKVSPKHLDKLDKALQQQLPEISIIDLLVDATKWLPLKRFFGPLSGHQGQLSDFDKRLVISLFCYGCNLGPTQTARSIEGFSRKQIAYLNLSHTSEKDLVDATTQVINAYNQYDLPGYWGTGNTASVDGTRFDMYEQNLLSEYHIRYASYGGVGYYLVSDNYIALFSRFIPCGVREAVHLIDGLMENESDIQPTRIHGDTHAQSTVVFGIAHLLGIKLMPRIRDINSLILFKPDRRQAYEHIDAILSDGINYDLIRNHYREMLRVIISIKLGKVTASTIIRRLGSEGVRNNLFFAFRELGRVVRTQYLLEYIQDIEMRETVNAATCKSEEFNNFLQWIFFYNSGIIQENLRHEQVKIVKYNHLVANLIVLHNVNAMTKVLKRLRRNDFDVTPEMLAALSPYRTSHINLLGQYPLETNRRVKAQIYRL